MHSCDLCGSEYTSSWAAAQCEDDCVEADRNTRGWFDKYRPNHER